MNIKVAQDGTWIWLSMTFTCSLPRCLYHSIKMYKMCQLKTFWHDIEVNTGVKGWSFFLIQNNGIPYTIKLNFLTTDHY